MGLCTCAWPSCEGLAWEQKQVLAQARRDWVLTRAHELLEGPGQVPGLQRSSQCCFLSVKALLEPLFSAQEDARGQPLPGSMASWKVLIPILLSFPHL